MFPTNSIYEVFWIMIIFFRIERINCFFSVFVNGELVAQVELVKVSFGWI